MLDSVVAGVPRSFLLMFPANMVAGVDEDVMQLVWEVTEMEGIPMSGE